MPSKDPSKNQTTALAIPSSCISAKCCRSQAQASHVAHQIARTAVLYSVDEIIIYPGVSPIDINEDSANANIEVNETGSKKIVFGDDDGANGTKKTKDTLSEEMQECARLAGLLQLFITPSYLRKLVFKNLHGYEYAKKLPKIPGLPFMNHNDGKYLEGMSVKGKIENKQMEQRIKKKNKNGLQKSRKELDAESQTKYVNVGASDLVELVDQKVPLGARVTVDMETKKVVSPRKAYGNSGFGYSVRIASTLGKIFTESPYADGYSKTIYVPSEEFTSSKSNQIEVLKADPNAVSGVPNLLLLYGKWKEIFLSMKADQDLEQMDSPHVLFDGRLDIQRGVRTEDTLLISLAQILH